MSAHRAGRRTRRHAAVLGGLTLVAALGPGTGVALAASPGDKDCGDFTFQEDAQKVYDADRSDPNHLDGSDKDGIVCESLPHRGAASSGVTTLPVGSTPAGRAVPVRRYGVGTSGSAASGSSSSSSAGTVARSADLDCADFATRAQAQSVLDADPSDPDRLDADHDGVACESLPATEDVATRPAASTASFDATTPVGAAATGDGSSVAPVAAVSAVPADGSADAALVPAGLLGGAALAGAAVVVRRRQAAGRHRRTRA